MEIPTHITNLSRRDLTEIAQAANMKGGPGIIVEPQGDKYVIKVDQNWLVRVLDKLRSGNLT